MHRQTLRKLSNSIPFRNLRSEEHTSELQSRSDLVCRLLLEKKKQTYSPNGTRASQTASSSWDVFTCGRKPSGARAAHTQPLHWTTGTRIAAPLAVVGAHDF